MTVTSPESSSDLVSPRSVVSDKKALPDFVKDVKCPELQDTMIHMMFTVVHDYNLGIFGYCNPRTSTVSGNRNCLPALKEESLA